ncbi:unnamed protein product [Sphagnum balticum]
MLQLSDATAIEFLKALEPTDNNDLVVVLLAHLIPHDTLSMLARTLRQFVIRRLNVRSKRISARDTQDAGDEFIHQGTVASHVGVQHPGTAIHHNATS